MINLKELNDEDLARLLITMDKDRKLTLEAEKTYWNCVREINQREDTEEGVAHEDDESMWLFLDKVIEVSNGATRGIDIIFQCPICNNQGIIYISPSNGHKHAKCLNCDMEVLV